MDDHDIEQTAWSIYYRGAMDALEATVQSLERTKEKFGNISISLSTLIDVVNKSKAIFLSAEPIPPEGEEQNG